MVQHLGPGPLPQEGSVRLFAPRASGRMPRAWRSMAALDGHKERQAKDILYGQVDLSIR